MRPFGLWRWGSAAFCPIPLYSASPNLCQRLTLCLASALAYRPSDSRGTLERQAALLLRGLRGSRGGRHGHHADGLPPGGGAGGGCRTDWLAGREQPLLLTRDGNRETRESDSASFISLPSSLSVSTPPLLPCLPCSLSASQLAAREALAVLENPALVGEAHLPQDALRGQQQQQGGGAGQPLQAGGIYMGQ
jgi:hypothetical protein